jgi:hypothetical protein
MLVGGYEDETANGADAVARGHECVPSLLVTTTDRK